MANKKHYYYVLVLSNEGPVFVTEIGDHHVAYWEMDKKPLEFSRTYAEDITNGLRGNYINAVLVDNNYELECQPFRYDKGNFVWKWREDNDGNNV